MVSIPGNREKFKCAEYTGSITLTVSADSDGGSATTVGEPWDVGQFTGVVWGVNQSISGTAGASTHTLSVAFNVYPALATVAGSTAAPSVNFWADSDHIVLSGTDAGGAHTLSQSSINNGSQAYRGKYALPIATFSADCAGAIAVTATATVSYTAFYRQ